MDLQEQGISLTPKEYHEGDIIKYAPGGYSKSRHHGKAKGKEPLILYDSFSGAIDGE